VHEDGLKPRHVWVATNGQKTNKVRGGSLGGLLVLLLGALVTACGFSPASGSQIVPTIPVAYPDGRPPASYRLNATDAGIVLKHGDAPDTMGARDVYVYEANSRYYMNYDGASSAGWLTDQATSTDLTHWQKTGALLELGASGSDDSASASYGTVYFDGSTYQMFYLGTPHTTPAPYLIPALPYVTMKAKSSSPAGPFVKEYSVIPFSVTPGTYYSATASPGQIVKQGDTYLQFFSAAMTLGSDIERSIGIARTTDLDGTWQPDSEPVVPPDEQVENTSLYYQVLTQTWFMFVNHVGINADRVEYTDAVWVYWTQDINNWNPTHKAVVLDGTNSTWSHMIVGLPSVVPFGGRLAIFYDGEAVAPPPGSDLILLHMNRDIGLAWLDLPIKTP
jgi:hypothetical protein